MEHEIELKLLTNKQAGEVIETKLLPQLDAKVTHNRLLLTNQYFDTPDRILRQHNIGLRIRGNNQEFEQTLKTSGWSIGGLHQRPEYNVQLDDSNKRNVKTPNLRLFPLSVWPETIDVDILQTKLETLFMTHFERKIYLIEFSWGDIIELVWDLGEVTSGAKSTPICEIELELKKGSTAAIFDLAKRIVGLLPTTIGNDSKAARGYQLLDDLPIMELDQFKQSISDEVQNGAEVFARSLTIQLQNFQILSAEIRRQYNDVLAVNINRVLSALVQNVAEFNRHFHCLPIELIYVALKKLAKDWSLVLQQHDENAAIRLLVRAETTQLQLDIVQYVVEQPWSSNT